MVNNSLTQEADKLAMVKIQISALEKEKDMLEATFLTKALDDLKNTKFKTVCFPGTGSVKVYVTQADSAKVVDAYINDLKLFFGSAYPGCVKAKVNYSIEADPARMVAGILTGQIIHLSLQEVLDQIPCDDKARKLLKKKVKGTNYAKDIDNIENIAKVSHDDAVMYAYFAKEAFITDRYNAHKNAEGIPDEKEREWLDHLQRAVIVEQTPKVVVVSE